MEASPSQSRWLQVQRLSAEIVGLEAERREARLRLIRDSLLREEVEALLERLERGEQIDDEQIDEGPGLAPAPPSFEGASPPPPGTGPPVVTDEYPEGDRIRHYRLIEEIGRGAMGVVYRAEDTRLGRSVALKFLSPQLSTDARARARLEREARAASALDHPNICTVYEIGETDDGRLYLALACYDGETLQRHIERGPLPVDEAVRVGVHVARGLAAAHRHGIVHRDVKPSNILVTDERVVKLLDFGIARVAGSDLTDSGDTLGTVAYMSPEQLRGEVDARADVWALGVVLHEMLTGARPFRGDYEAALLYTILHEPPEPVTRADVPEDLAEIVRRCLDKDPTARYQSAEEVEVALERLGLREALQPVLRRVARRRRGLLAGLGAAVVALAVLASPLRTAVVDRLGFGATDMQHLAVLPLMAPAYEASMGEGLTLALTSLLTRLGADAEEPIRVVPASEMREVATAAEARERFGVDVVVSGDFQQDGEEAHLTLNLIDARTLRQIDSERLTEAVDRLPALQLRAITTLAGMLDLHLSDRREAMLTAGGTTDPEAFSYYMQGQANLDRFDKEENVESAQRLFEMALREDAHYALAYAGLCEVHLMKYATTRRAEHVAAADSLCQRALDLNDRLAPVHVTRGDLHLITGRFEQAASAYRLARSLDSTEAEAHRGLGETYASLGRSAEAEAAYKGGVRLQPDYWAFPHAYGKYLLKAGRVEEAAGQFERSMELAPDNEASYSNMGVVSIYRGDLGEAKRWFEEANDIEPNAGSYNGLAYLAYAEGEFDREAEMYRRALGQDSANYAIWGNLGDAYARLDRDEEATDAYRHAVNLIRAALDVNPQNAEALSDFADYATSLGFVEEALARLNRVPLDAQGEYFLPRRMAGAYAKLGHSDEAFRWIEEGFERGLSKEGLLEDGRLDVLSTDGRYQQFFDTKF